MQNEGYQTIISFILCWILFGVLVEALTEIIKKAGPLESFRCFLSKRSEFFVELLSCGWCLSVWVSFFIAWIIPGPIELLIKYGFDHSVLVFVNEYLWWFINGMILHRISNIIHMRVTSENEIILEGEENEQE